MVITITIFFCFFKTVYIFISKNNNRTMLDKLNKILISLEDAVDSEDWSLVQHAINKLEELYEKIEMEEQFGEYDD